MSRKVRLDNKGVRCPNSTLQGFSVGTAKAGLWCQFSDSAHTGAHMYCGIVIGRIAELYDQLEDCTGYLVLRALSTDCTFWMERWVRPENVLALVPIPKTIRAPKYPKEPNRALAAFRETL